MLNEQPLFVQPVVKPGCRIGLTTTAGCRTGCQTGLTTGWMFVHTIQPVVKTVWQPVWQRVTGLTTGLTTGCIVYTNIYPVVKPFWQPVWQQVISCKRGFTKRTVTSPGSGTRGHKEGVKVGAGSHRVADSVHFDLLGLYRVSQSLLYSYSAPNMD